MINTFCPFRRRLSTLPILVLIFAACSDDHNAEIGTIHGNATFTNGIPASDVSILLDDQAVGQTANDGSFRINANFGEHDVSLVSGNKSGQFSSKTMTVILSTSSPVADLEGVKLPLPVTLGLLSQDGHNIHLKWAPSTASDFREYRLYMNYSEAFDEDASTLLLTTTERNDTLYSINDGVIDGIRTLSPGQTYYFRVVVMNEYGKLGGSNILVVTHIDAYDNPIYELTELLNFYPPAAPTGITYDGSHLWISTVVRLGGYYDPDDIRLIKYDYQSGTKLKEFSLSNHVETRGISFAGGRVWMASNALKAIDTLSGAVAKEFAIPLSINDVTFDGQYITLLDEWGLVRRINPQNGIGGPSTQLPLGSGWRGIANRGNGETWAVHWVAQKLLVFDNTGNLKGSVQTNLLADCGFCFEAGFYLTFLDEDTLAIIKWNSVFLLKISEI